MVEKYNYYCIDEFTWDLINTYLRHGYGLYKMYDITAFHANMDDEIAVMTIEEFAHKAERTDGQKWHEVSNICPMCEDCPDGCPLVLYE